MEINNVADYINTVSQIISNQDKDITIVYRGESRIFDTPCQPNIFRKSLLKNNKFFEKNLFDEMTSNKITSGTTYLEKAIDAQHGGFPSRLLDVTYNSLVALYFATTPYFHYPENSEDDHDGIVYIYFFNKLFCPSGKNITDNYKAIIDRDHVWLSSESIFQKNHKLIDHIKLNKRIVAQQGALILFQGDEVCPISNAKYTKIRIPSKSKSAIRTQLKTLFGIHTGFIYPEPSNLVTEISDKSNKIANTIFDLDTELNLLEYNLQLDLTHQETLVIQKANDSSVSNKDLIVHLKDVEELIFSYKLGIEELCTHNTISTTHKLITNYNKLVHSFITSITFFLNQRNIDICEKELCIS